MSAKSLYGKLPIAILALLASVPWVHAQDGLEGALSRTNFASPANLGVPFRHTIAAADFDGDNKPDGAVLLDDGWLRPRNRLRTIEIHLSGRRNTELTFESNETAGISALDVNHDGATDIVVEQSFTHERLQIWLNDGHGGFRKAPAQDFPSVNEVIGKELESPSERQNCPAACLPPQRSSDGAALAARASPHRTLSVPARTQALESMATSRAIAPDSSRAPPTS